MNRNPSRPMSPHLTIWKWGPHMLVSILHRVTGAGLSVVGGAIFVWWLVALASGPDAYRSFTDLATSWFGILVFVGLTWAFWTKAFGGIRHLVMDIGAGFEIQKNKLWSIIVVALGIVFTGLTWAYIYWRAGA
ncbi:MAG TPA: succinate dehydrogenase, cytochrome b556 subunit [Allosphingosinicella sp.]|jgi:succinate dehydrogenase / fumarate reductase cytochrome b subunit|uniref:succinate dehydrogenase, cytochrome b556 subunit n=1 Tax=Allosphingosinicella sp. TaxID=2823234 RepID=UPI002F28BF69